MKIALIADQHFGARNNSNLFFDYFDRFYNDRFFPYLDEHGIDVILNAGDHLDNRKTINVLAGQRFSSTWIKNLCDRNIQEHSILGNHTVYYRNTNKVNSLDQFYKDKDNLHLYTVSPEEVEIGGIVWGMIPWITTDNKEECLEFIRTTKAQILFGHFEIIGFYMDGGHKCETGISVSELKRFDRVFSGHFHKKQTLNNVSYLGTPYDLTYADIGETKGFHVFDTETMDMEFIPFDEKLFYKFVYDDVENDYNFDEYDFSKLKGCFVKLIVSKRKDDAKYEILLDKLEEIGIYKLDIIETIEDAVYDNSVDMSLSTIEIINNHIDSSDSVSEPEALKRIMGMVYTEAMNM